MARGKSEHDWRITASLRAGFANGKMKKRGGKLFTEDDFDPYAKQKAGAEKFKLSGKNKSDGFKALRSLI